MIKITFSVGVAEFARRSVRASHSGVRVRMTGMHGEVFVELPVVAKSEDFIVVEEDAGLRDAGLPGVMNAHGKHFKVTIEEVGPDTDEFVDGEVVP